MKFGSVAWWDEYFKPGGGWERNGGRRQTRVFAEVFSKHVRLDGSGHFHLLDVGCGLGEAIQILHAQYPTATFTGMDVSRVSISRCGTELGDLAEFRIGGIEDVQDRFDVIYVSNVLEHFVDYKRMARHLAAHCHRLCVMIPFDERDGVKPLSPNPTRQHQHTFLKDAFDFLVHEGRAVKITSHIVSCPGVWSMERRRWALERCKNVVKAIIGRPTRRNRYQIIFDVVTSSVSPVR